MATQVAQFDAASVEAQVLEIVRELLIEMGKQESVASVSLDSSFVRDLGIASLDLVELLVRCEARFEIELPDEIAEQADTPAGWVKAILHGGQEAAAKPAYRIPPPGLEPLPEAVGAATLVEVLTRLAEQEPGRVHIHLLEEDSGHCITYGRLYEGASSVAAGLAARGLRRNDTVAIMLPTCEEFFEAFFGVMLAGGIPVPVYPPTRPDRIEEYVKQQVVVLRSAGIRFLTSFKRIEAVTQVLRVNLPDLADEATVEELRQTRGRVGGVSANPAEVALVQYTSGSTGDPKGVTLTHANILANIRAIGAAVGVRPGDAVVSWLPLYSDLGLVGTWLFGLYHGVPVTILSPLDFLHRPERWLWAIHDSRGTLSPAPNFAYELCIRRIPAWTLEGVDLSSWRVAVNAGEPVLAQTVARFTERFRKFGFRPESMLPCYGLAESSVALTMAPIDRLPVKDTIRRGPFEAAGRAEHAPADDPATLCFFSVGHPIQGQQVRVVDEQGREVGERIQGHVQFRGLTTTSGYFRNPQATQAATTPDGWMDTGDYGYTAGGELYITGRTKDPIVKEGRSMSPLEVEAAVGSLPGVLAGSVVAFAAPDLESGTERLNVAAETRAASQEDFPRIEAEIVQLVDEMLGMPPDKILLIEPGCLPKTANGKIRRSETISLFLRGRLRSSSRPPWLQLVRLRLQNLGPLLILWARRSARLARRLGTTALAWAGAASASGWARITGNRKALIAAARWLLGIQGRRVKVSFSAPVEAGVPAILVANRYEVLDPLAIAAALGERTFFADDSALRGLPKWAARLVRPMVSDEEKPEEVPPGGVARQRIRRALQKGARVVVLPEGPIGAPPERSRFRLDAFHAAMETGCCLHPVAVKENSIATSDGLARRSRETEIIVGEPARPGETDDVFQLRETVRGTIARIHA